MSDNKTNGNKMSSNNIVKTDAYGPLYRLIIAFCIILAFGFFLVFVASLIVVMVVWHDDSVLDVSRIVWGVISFGLAIFMFFVPKLVMKLINNSQKEGLDL